MAGLMPIVAGGPGDQFNVTDDNRNHPLGSVMLFADGRRYKYGRAAATEIASGQLCQQTLNVADHDELAVDTPAVGTNVFVVTNGATTAITVDDHKDGYLNVEDDTGEAYLYTIRSNSAAATNGACTVTTYEPVQVALGAAATVLLYKIPMAEVILHPAPATALLVGVTCRIVTASDFGWFQTWGPASVLIEGTTVINERVIDSATADGAVAPTASTAAGEENYVGVTMEVAATTEYGLIFLQMA